MAALDNVQDIAKALEEGNYSTGPSQQHFKASRENGRSDRDVIVELAADAAPGTIFSFEKLRGALEQGTSRSFSNAVISAAVRTANAPLLKTKQRTLVSVRGEGYQIAYAADHNTVALQRHRRADNQLARGVEVLANVRLEELTPVQRQIHEGTMLVMGALHSAVTGLHKRQQKTERLLASLVAAKN